MKSFAPLLGLAAVVYGQTQQIQPNAVECAQANILAQLIQANILDQQEEQKAVGLVQQAVAKGDQVAFAQARDQLLTVVNNGITIRQAGQKIAPKNNAAAAGLETVRNAQLTELNLALNLTGNAQNDDPIIAELQKDFAGGIEQNKKNLAAATQGCAGNANNNGTAAGNGTANGNVNNNNRGGKAKANKGNNGGGKNGNNAGENGSGNNEAAGNNAAGNNASGENSSGNNAAGNNASGENSSSNNASGENASGGSALSNNEAGNNANQEEVASAASQEESSAERRAARKHARSMGTQ